VTPVEQEPKALVPVTPKTEEGPDLKTDLHDAYIQTKDNLQELIDQGKDAMEEILQIAKAGQHPRAFEVYGTLLKNVVDANKELLAVQKQMRDMDGKKKEGDTKIDKAIFVGSTAELNKLLKSKDE
jgi:predicted  nucleic acid-binding Zn-ribbon protein